MTKTVQELINNALNEGKKLSGYELQEILEKCGYELQEILEKYKTEIYEKNKEIEELKEELKEELILKENQIKNLNLRHERELEEELNSWKRLALANSQQIEFLKIAIREYKKTELFKEDFKKIVNTSYSSKDHTSIETWELKDNSLYDKLPLNKETKYWI